MPDSLFSREFQSVFSQVRDAGGTPKAFPSPIDWRDQGISFLMVDRFNNTRSTPPQALRRSDLLRFSRATLWGLRTSWPTSRGPGAGATWLSPVLKNVPLEEGTYHGYGIHHSLRADPRFANDPSHADDELRSLVDAAHQLGLYVILDIVLNHTGNVFAYQWDVGEKTCLDSKGAEASFRRVA